MRKGERQGQHSASKWDLHGADDWKRFGPLGRTLLPNLPMRADLQTRDPWQRPHSAETKIDALQFCIDSPGP